MNILSISLRVKSLVWTSVCALVISAPLVVNSAVADTLSDQETVGFSIVGGPTDPPDSCLESPYVLSTDLGASVDDPAVGESWLSPDITIAQSSGISCPGDVTVSAVALDITATPFTNNLAVGGDDLISGIPAISCDGGYGAQTRTATEGASVSCSSTINKVNIAVDVPAATAVSGTIYQSTVTITAVL